MAKTALPTTQDYFEIHAPEGWTVEEFLQAQDSDGYTMEENMLLDASGKTLFYDSLASWEADADWYRESGICVWEILQMSDGRIAVLTC